MERETGIEPATHSLGSRAGCPIVSDTRPPLSRIHDVTRSVSDCVRWRPGEFAPSLAPFLLEAWRDHGCGSEERSSRWLKKQHMEGELRKIVDECSGSSMKAELDEILSMPGVGGRDL